VADDVENASGMMAQTCCEVKARAGQPGLRNAEFGAETLIDFGVAKGNEVGFVSEVLQL